MKPVVLLDTGPLVAAINRRDKHHAWARLQLAELSPPLLSCEAVLAEACFLLRAAPGGADAVLELVRRGVIEVSFHAGDHVAPIARLMKKYADMPMSFADACLVRMSEIHADSSTFTIDKDFRQYRRHGRQVIPLLVPTGM